MIKYYVYWYHLPEHNAINLEGYVGITKDLHRRHKEHKYSANKDNSTYLDTHFTRAINKHKGIDNLQKTVLYEGSFEIACEIENALRSKLNIGWNIAIGGRYPGEGGSIFKGVTDRWTEEQKSAIGEAHKGKKLTKEHIEAIKTKNRANPNLGTSITLFHKDDINKLYTYHSISEASRQLGIPLSRLKSKNQRKTTSYGEDGWAILFDNDFDRSTTLTGRQLAGQKIKQTLKNKSKLRD